MGRIVNFIRTPGQASSQHALLVAELNRNIGEVHHNTGPGHNYSRHDAADTIAIINVEMAAATLFMSQGTAVDSIPGEATVPPLWGAPFKCVDIVTLRNSVLHLSECKVAMKRTGFGPFFDEESFKNDLAEKFDEVSSRAATDGDSVSQLRVVLVAAALLDRTIELIQGLEDLRLGPGAFSTDGLAHDYLVCTTASLDDVTNGMNPTFPLSKGYRFRL